MGSGRRPNEKTVYGAKFGALDRRHGEHSPGLGGARCRHRPSEPEPGSDVSEPAADASAAACSADDAVSRTGPDPTAAALAASQSSAMSGGDHMPPR
jgi:hypothetical protein